MRRLLPNPDLAQTIAWIWLVFVLSGLLAWLAYRFWRRRHPVPPPAPQLSYSQRLQQRVMKGRATSMGKRHKRHAASKRRRD